MAIIDHMYSNEPVLLTFKLDGHAERTVKALMSEDRITSLIFVFDDTPEVLTDSPIHALVFDSPNFDDCFVEGTYSYTCIAKAANPALTDACAATTLANLEA